VQSRDIPHTLPSPIFYERAPDVIIVIYLNVGYNIAIYLNVGTLIIDAINVKIQLSPWLTSSF
jgi:hypothetical protein